MSNFLFHLPMRGMGTADVECLGSYLYRQAYQHRIGVGKLLELIYQWYTKQQEAKDVVIPAFQSLGSPAVLIRPNDTTDSLVRILSAATGDVSVRSGTFLALKDALHRSMTCFSRHFRWCPVCMQEFERADDSGYYKLVWQLKRVRFCSVHGVPLVDQCHYCGSYQGGYAVKNECLYCRKCGRPLTGGVSEEYLAPYRVGLNCDLHELVAEIARSPTLSYPRDSVKRLIKHLFDQAWGQGEEQRLWACIPKNECLAIVTGHKPVTLMTAQRLSYWLSVRLVALLEGDISLASDQLDPTWSEQLPKDLQPRKRVYRYHRQTIQEALLKYVTPVDGEAPLPLTAVARRIGSSVGYLHYHFPVLARRITEAHQLWKRAQRKHMRIQARMAALRLFVESREQGVICSRKRALKILREKTGYSRNLLSQEIRVAFNALQAK